MSGARTRTHGRSKTAEYRVWTGMKTRCTNPNDKRYADYGARGIRICDEWLASFEAFLKDMGPRPSRRHTLDRIDVNGHYEPANCRWLPAPLQTRNTRANRVIEHRGVRGSVAEVAEHFGVNSKNVYERLARGWSVADAIERPLRVWPSHSAT